MQLIQPKIYVTEFSVDECLKYVEQLEAIYSLYGSNQSIIIQVESPGGDLVGLFILLDALNSIPNPIFTYTTGMACSAGFSLLVTGNRNGGQRIVGENAHLMVHGIQMGFGNGFSDLKDVEERVRSAKVMNEQFLKPIARALNLDTIEKLEELIKSKTKSHDLNLTAQEAKELGMIDVIGALRLEPPMPEFKLMVMDSDIDSHRKNCTNEECACKVSNKEIVEEVKKIKKKKKLKKSKE